MGTPYRPAILGLSVHHLIDPYGQWIELRDFQDMFLKGFPYLQLV